MTIVVKKNCNNLIRVNDFIKRLKKIVLVNCICEIFLYKKIEFEKFISCDIVLKNHTNMKLTPLNNAEDYSCEIYGENSPDDHYLSREYVDIDEKYDNDESNDSYVETKKCRMLLIDEQYKKRIQYNKNIYANSFENDETVYSLLIVDNKYKELIYQNKSGINTDQTFKNDKIVSN